MRQVFLAFSETNQKYTVGVYHSLTENSETHNGVENDSSNFNMGAYLSF